MCRRCLDDCGFIWRYYTQWYHTAIITLRALITLAGISSFETSLLWWLLSAWVFDPNWTVSQSQSYITTDCQPASLSWNKAPIWGLTTRSWLLSDSCGFVGLGRPVWREDRSAVFNCYWPSPAQSFSGPSPVGLVAKFYCLRFETSLFVASYDSQGHGGGIRPRLHTG
jgi:hypothetical protein